MRTLLLTLVLLVAAAPAAFAGEATAEGGHVVRWDDGLDHAAKRTIRMLPAIQQEVEDRLGFPFEGGPATVILASGLDSMREHAGSKVPEWAGGVCIGRLSRIVLRIDVLTPESPLRSIQTTFRHEWVHLAWSRRAGANARYLPRWLEEGIAEEIGGGVSVDAGATLDYAVTFGHLVPLEQLHDRFPSDAATAGLAYRQGQSWVRYFVRERSWEDLRSILLDLADGKGATKGAGAGRPFEALVRDRTGSSVGQWSARWQRHLEEDARPWFHLLGKDLGWTLIVAAALISVGAFFAIRWRRKKAFEALPDG